jgi:predicted O-methyltransferase YrrM
MGTFIQATDALVRYLGEVGARTTAAQVRCREETQHLPAAIMQISPEEGATLQILARLIGAKRYLEIGVFTGYSALAVALALPADGKVVGLDVSKKYTDMARGYWKEAGVDTKIDLRLGPALVECDRMIANGEPLFDFVFIDADKTSYDAYYERALRLVRQGGLIAIDNALFFGRVADPGVMDGDTVAVRALNAKIHADRRVDMALASVGDGVMLAIRR